MAGNSLATIQQKVRRLTRNPSQAQLSDADLNQYINTFVLYDFPEQLRLFRLNETFTFFCAPNKDTYKAGDGYLPANFDQVNITTGSPCYIDGYETWWSQSRQQIFAAYPEINTIQLVTNGDGVTTTFTGTLNATPVLQNQVMFGSADANNNGLSLSDDGNGNLTGSGTGTVNYLTGAFTLNFNTPPASLTQINAHFYTYVASRPLSVLYFQNQITLRPVPDQPYRINFEVYVRPAELLATNQVPELEQWWQYIAYGTAKKIFEDKQDLDSVALIMPEFKQQERMALRTTLVQQSNDRSATIYSQNFAGSGYGWFGLFNG